MKLNESKAFSLHYKQGKTAWRSTFWLKYVGKPLKAIQNTDIKTEKTKIGPIITIRLWIIKQSQHHWVERGAHALVSGQWVDTGPHVNSLLSSSQETLVRRDATEIN